MLQNNQEKEIILLQNLGMLYPKETSKQKRRYGLYKCFCGNEFKTEINSIKSGNTKSCGCLHSITISKLNTTHGLSKHKLYAVWNDMMQRCNNVNNEFYIDYGNRGIKVCEKWKNIKNFIEDMYPSYQKGLSIDRIDNNKGYFKENCRWATKDIQSQNTRKIQSNNTSGYRGVNFDKAKQKWRAQIHYKNKNRHLGYFKNKIDAAKAYDQYVINNNLEHAINFDYNN